MTGRKSMLLCDAEFHRVLKCEASKRGISIVEMTRLLSKNVDLFDKLERKNEKGFSFKF